MHHFELEKKRYRELYTIYNGAICSRQDRNSDWRWFRSTSIDSHTLPFSDTGIGINLCFANLLLSRGCNVLFADVALRKEAEESVQRYANSKAGGPLGRAAFQKTDVSEWKQLERMFKTAQSKFGGTGADIVVPGAGVYEPVRGARHQKRRDSTHSSQTVMVKFLVSTWFS